MAEFSQSSSIPSDSIDDHLNSLPVKPPINAGDDGGAGDVDLEEERESGENNVDETRKTRFPVKLGFPKHEDTTTTEFSESSKNQQNDRNSDESIEEKMKSMSVKPAENGGEEVGEMEEREKRRKSRFPVRLGFEDCSFYVRTGMCKFGMNCKFNHPPLRKFQGGKVKGKEELVDDDDDDDDDEQMVTEKERYILCKYFDRPGGCKFGNACKFNHSRKTFPTVELNYVGLPIRPGEKECPYYMRTGSCKYGAHCRFNHPDPTSVGGPDNLPAYSNGASNLSSNAPKSTMASWSPPAASLNESPPYVPLMFPPTHGVSSPRPEWTAYRAPAYPTERNMNMPPAYTMNGPLDTNIYAHQQEKILADEFPERPGQPECSYFIKTGNCKYRSACKFHHPKNMTIKSPACTLSDSGLPIRPGETVCSYYNRYGLCKYGPACKYDHPIHSAHSAPFPVSATDEIPSSLDDSGVNDGAVTTGAELEANI